MKIPGVTFIQKPQSIYNLPQVEHDENSFLYFLKFYLVSYFTGVEPSLILEVLKIMVYNFGRITPRFLRP